MMLLASVLGCGTLLSFIKEQLFCKNGFATALPRTSGDVKTASDFQGGQFFDALVSFFGSETLMKGDNQACEN
jgi:hypothetical protein